eukprot:349244_1
MLVDADTSTLSLDFVFLCDKNTKEMYVLKNKRGIRHFCFYGGLLLIFSSLVLSTIVIFTIEGIPEASMDMQIFVASNTFNRRRHIIAIEFPFEWHWNHSQIELQSMYKMKHRHYDTNQLLFNHSYSLHINWNTINIISNMSLVNTSNTDSIKTNFFKLFTALSSNSKISFSFSSILTWKISTQTKDQRYPNLAHCRSQFYSQTLYVYNGISALSYLSVHNVLLIKEPSLNPTQHNQLMLWIFVTNPFIYQFYKSAGYQNQSKYMR